MPRKKSDAGMPLFEGVPERAPAKVAVDDTLLRRLDGKQPSECNPPYTDCVVDDDAFCWTHGAQHHRSLVALEDEVE